MPDTLPPDWHADLAPEAVLRPGALAWLRGWLARQGDGADLLYGDEDRLDGAGRRHAPWFKPGWVPESFWSTPWLGSGSFWRISWLQCHGLWPPPSSGASGAAGSVAAGSGAAGGGGPDGLAQWQWQLRALEQRPRLAHLPRILIHRRTGDASGMPGGIGALPTATLAAALADHLRRSGEGPVLVQPLPALTSTAGTTSGSAATEEPRFGLSWAVPPTWRMSVVVLSRDRPDLLQRCLSSVEANAAVARRRGLDLEWILVDNGSRLEATAALLHHWRQRPGSRLHVLPLDQPFNWSLLNNRAAATSRAELLLFLNNDIEAPAPSSGSDWLAVMVGQALRPAIGAVGARLLYRDGSLQHAGLLPPLGQGCEHPYRHLSPTRLPHRGRAGFLTGWPAVTGACLMVRRTLWQRSGGFDPALPVEGNDVDFCLRLGHLGLRHVVCPEATLLHHEGASRDLSRSATWGPAQALLQRRWPGAMAQAAPWWPRACSLETTDGRPRELAGRGWP
ncbi:glycosyltransferase [Synechococcus sp. CBW1004]|uniref:glycosyltransferase family 2 protein n=1 Tax=Synechococcus sp. CBW1004 TaxID=1353136 RepID=UPI0018CEDF2B|nr:glycosyltransferase [Synechococcus sp. CBW1004]QPN64389.1 glycosyltransferase [Synechococcus sp. CBW1004]